MSASNEVEFEILSRYFAEPVWVALYQEQPPETALDPLPDPPVAQVVESKVPVQVGDRRAAQFAVQDNVATLTDELQWTGLGRTTVQSLGLWTAESEGKLLFKGYLTYRQQTRQGTLRFLPGSISVAVD